MAVGYRYQCNRCKREESAQLLRTRVYQLAGNLHTYLQAELAWCNGCARLVAAEWLPPLQLLESWRSALMQVSPDDPELQREATVRQISPAELLAHRQRAALERVRWRQQRRSPPRCLECSSSDIRVLADGDEVPAAIPHPSCGGEFILIGKLFASESSWDRYDPEGNLIDRPSAGSIVI